MPVCRKTSAADITTFYQLFNQSHSQINSAVAIAELYGIDCKISRIEGRNLCHTGFLAGSRRYKKFSALPDFHNIFPPFLQTIDYSSPRGGISVETNTSGNIPTSYLLIDSVAPSDSGKYTCRPANAGEISVNVHIQDGK